MPRKAAVRPGRVEDGVHVLERLAILELHGPHNLVAATQVLGPRSEAPSTGARCRAHAPLPGGGEHHLARPTGAPLRRSLTCGTRSPSAPRPAGAGCGYRCDPGTRTMAAMPRPWATTIAWYAKSNESGLCSRSTTMNSNPALGNQLERLEAGQLHPRAERREIRDVAALGNAHGIGYSSWFSTQPGRSEKSMRGGQKMSTSWWRMWPTLWLVCTVGGGMIVMAGLAQSWCSSSRHSSRSTVHGVRMWCT